MLYGQLLSSPRVSRVPSVVGSPVGRRGTLIRRGVLFVTHSPNRIGAPALLFTNRGGGSKRHRWEGFGEGFTGRNSALDVCSRATRLSSTGMARRTGARSDAWPFEHNAQGPGTRSPNRSRT
jgi:hypothetical protein